LTTVREFDLRVPANAQLNSRGRTAKKYWRGLADFSLSGPSVFIRFQVAVNQAQKREISVRSVMELAALQ
jgi:hypothetical protein